MTTFPKPTYLREVTRRGQIPEPLAKDAPDEHLTCFAGGIEQARCSLWWRQTPSYGARRVGLIGHYAAQHEEAADALLHQALDRLAAQGCTLAVGPMDGASWRPYRLVTERGTRPPFFLEPDHPASFPAHFMQAGFTPLAAYRSAVTPELDRRHADVPEADAFTAAGFRLRPIDPDRLADDLALLYALTAASFRDNLLYTPPPQEAFRAHYERLAPHLRPELVRFLEREGEAVGYCFMLPDLLQAQRGEPVDTVIIKTMALLPEVRGGGVGRWLAAEAHRQAHALGFRRVIHALMHETNASARLSRHYGETMRRYTLFAKPLF